MDCFGGFCGFYNIENDTSMKARAPVRSLLLIAFHPNPLLYQTYIFQVILAVLLSWMVCGILTAAGVFSDNPKNLDYHARTDASVRVLHNAKWFFFPYPGTHSY